MHPDELNMLFKEYPKSITNTAMPTGFQHSIEIWNNLNAIKIHVPSYIQVVRNIQAKPYEWNLFFNSQNILNQ